MLSSFVLTLIQERRKNRPCMLSAHFWWDLQVNLPIIILVVSSALVITKKYFQILASRRTVRRSFFLSFEQHGNDKNYFDTPGVMFIAPFVRYFHIFVSNGMCTVFMVPKLRWEIMQEMDRGKTTFAKHSTHISHPVRTPRSHHQLFADVHASFVDYFTIRSPSPEYARQIDGTP